MKQVVMAVSVGLGLLALTGCAELQQQGGGFLSQQNQPQQVAMEGGQPVQTLGSSRSQGSSVRGSTDQGESSFVSDMAKEATGTLKNEVSSSIRSAIRGALGR